MAEGCGSAHHSSTRTIPRQSRQQMSRHVQFEKWLPALLNDASTVRTRSGSGTAVRVEALLMRV